MPKGIEFSVLLWVVLVVVVGVAFLLLFIPIIRREFSEPGWFKRVYHDEPMEVAQQKWEKNPTRFETFMFLLDWNRMPKSRKDL